jgi:hypothetical protein
VVVADDRAVVGSYDYLTADPYATARRPRELSIELSGEIGSVAPNGPHIRR